jgi:hypothetical protein
LTTIDPPFKEKKESWHFILFFAEILDPDQKIIMLYRLSDNISKAVQKTNIFKGYI